MDFFFRVIISTILIKIILRYFINISLFSDRKFSTRLIYLDGVLIRDASYNVCKLTFEIRIFTLRYNSLNNEYSNVVVGNNCKESLRLIHCKDDSRWHVVIEFLGLCILAWLFLYENHVEIGCARLEKWVGWRERGNDSFENEHHCGTRRIAEWLPCFTQLRCVSPFYHLNFLIICMGRKK